MSLRLGIDLRYTSASHLGTGSYAEQATRDLLGTLDGTDRLHAFTDGVPTGDLLLAGCNWHPVGRGFGRWGAAAGQDLWAAALRRNPVDVFFSPTGLAPSALDAPLVVTVHDLLFEREPDWMAPGLATFLKSAVRSACQVAERVVAISEHTRQDVISRYGIPAEQVVTVHQSLHGDYRQRPSEERIRQVCRKHGISDRYLLTVSNFAPHKNTGFALEVFAQWCKGKDRKTILVIAGGGPAPQAQEDLQQRITELGITDRVRLVGRVPQCDLPALYAGARGFLFPSRFEGWGLPPLEAVAMGTPAITSDAGALPEALGGAGFSLPLELAAWVEALDRLREGVPPEMSQAMDRRRQEVLASSGPALRRVIDTVVEKRRATSGGGRQITLSGCMIIKNGVSLGYPFVEAIHAVIDQVDEFVVVDGASEDGTWDVLQQMATTCPKLKISQDPWPTITSGGKVIAEATNRALPKCVGSHILYVQADEIFPSRLVRQIRALLEMGYDAAATPFLHFRTSWWRIIDNPAYHATLRVIPNRPSVTSALDGVTFTGDYGACIPPAWLDEAVFHVGWVYTGNTLAKHRNHARLYADHPDYQRKAAEAERLGDQAVAEDLGRIDGDYRLRPFTGEHPVAIRHLLEQVAYDPAPGLARWHGQFHPA